MENDSFNKTWSNFGKTLRESHCKIRVNGKETLAEGFKDQKYRIYFFEPRITRQFSYLFTNLRIF